MTAAQMEVMELIKTIPEERMDNFVQMVKNFVAGNDYSIGLTDEEHKKRELFKELDELFDKEPPLTEEQRKRAHENAEKFRIGVQKIRESIGNDIPWSSEEEMIEELARDRRERMERMAQ